MAEHAGIRPTLKWVGGKAWLAERVRALLPPEIRGTYHEPFVGGAAVFCSLSPVQLPLFSEAGRQHVPGDRASISDLSPDLVAFYEAVRDDVESVIAQASSIRDEYLDLTEPERAEYYSRTRTFFNELRGAPPGLLQETKRVRALQASRFLFLNKTGFNGLMRYNRAGQLNTPHGRYSSPRVLCPDDLRAMSRALQGVSVEVSDFESRLTAAREGDAAYLDPPHAARSATSVFVGYTATPWTAADERRVARVFWALARRGVRVVLSQADTEAARATLFEDARGTPFEATTVMRRGTVSSKGGGRAPVAEMLVAAGPAAW